MLSIIAGHWCSYAGIYLYDMGGLGVHIFLLLSGYLCGIKEVSQPIQWYKKRFIRIMKPMWIWTIILIVVAILFGTFQVGYFTSLLGLNGIGWILPFTLPSTSDMSHTWFVTVILICYLIVPLLQKIEWQKKAKAHVLFGTLILLQFGLVFIGVQLIFFVQFIIGYYLSKVQKGRKLISLGLLVIAVSAMRLIAHSVEVSEVLYGSIIAEWSENIIGLFIFLLFEELCSRFQSVSEKISENQFVKWLDEASYPAYITHYAFLHGVLCISSFSESREIQFVLFVVFVILSSAIVWFLDKVLRRKAV